MQPVEQPRLTGSKFRTFGPFGPPYQMGDALRRLDNGDWLFEIILIESGERAEYRLSSIVEDPEAV